MNTIGIVIAVLQTLIILYLLLNIYNLKQLVKKLNGEMVKMSSSHEEELKKVNSYFEKTAIELSKIREAQVKNLTENKRLNDEVTKLRKNQKN